MKVQTKQLQNFVENVNSVNKNAVLFQQASKKSLLKNMQSANSLSLQGKNTKIIFDRKQELRKEAVTSGGGALILGGAGLLAVHITAPVWIPVGLAAGTVLCFGKTIETAMEYNNLRRLK
jgi:hypothetical protein